MSKRNYNQFCPLATGMDIIGERWTLLIIRELLFSPRRYTDLQKALPSMGTNLLSKRLKVLDEAGVITQRVLPPPAGSTVYELTSYGQQLEDAVLTLTRWGFQSMQLPPPSGVQFTLSSALVTMKAFFSATKAMSLRSEVVFLVEDEVYTLDVRQGKLTIDVGYTDEPDAAVETQVMMLMAIICGMVDAENAIIGGMMTLVSGDQSKVINLLRRLMSRNCRWGGLWSYMGEYVMKILPVFTFWVCCKIK